MVVGDDARTSSSRALVTNAEVVVAGHAAMVGMDDCGVAKLSTEKENNRKKGYGNFTTIQAAVDSIPDGNQHYECIIYDTCREKVYISESKSFIVLQGEGASRTRIDWDDHGDTMTLLLAILHLQ
ncbi:hypothetical protein ZIOFF_007832 [Zingiber officinale]|uniref:Uncharacterized protein n=1 Tax=Zingiber officinale TaxID=94328 RepID=A0A8J5M640_ZINOF|nr:hypothetical protein ZIOFF_007832 [Zingiber officinale]